MSKKLLFSPTIKTQLKQALWKKKVVLGLNGREGSSSRVVVVVVVVVVE